MNLDSNDDDSDESDFGSIASEDIDANLNHYRVPKLINYGPYGLSNFNGDLSRNNVGTNRSGANLKQVKFSNEGKIMSLFELAAQKVACHFPFGLVEHYDQPVPEPMQCRIAFWSFPQDEEDVKLYTCLANGSADYFYRAEELISQNSVRDMLQVGFHLSANIIFMNSETERLETFRVAVTFDRRRITACSCTCMETCMATYWCQHVVAVCLQRIRRPQDAKLRAPVSESLQRLEKNQLQKFAQYLINEFPQQILPAAQKLLDELLSGDEAIINKNPAAPDPTAGALLNEQTSWCLDFTHLSLDIRKILLKQCATQPTVCSDIQSLHVTAPPATTEYSQLLRPIRGREPEGIWNLISIVGEMMKRRDPNLYPLLQIMTEEIMKIDKIMTWWFETKVSLHSGSTIHFANTKNSQCTSQYSCSNFCDEIVHLWRLAALNPSSTSLERNKLYTTLFDWHLSILKRHLSLAENNNNNNNNSNQNASINLGIHSKTNKRNYLEIFPGFKSAMEGCQIDWSDWDEKRGELITVAKEINEKENEKTKAPRHGKHNKKRKRRARARQDTTAAATAIAVAAPETKISADDSDVKVDVAEQQQPLPSCDICESFDAKEDKDENKTDEKVENQNQNSNALQVTNNSGADIACKVLDETGPSNAVEEAVRVVKNINLKPRLPLKEIDENHQDNNNISDDEGEEEQVEQPNVINNNDNDQIGQIEPELQVYFMERQPENQQEQQKPETLEDFIKLNERRLADPLETLYAKIEGLHAHGHLEEARRVARRLAREILTTRNYPSLKQLFVLPRRKKKKGSLDNQMSIVASETLAKIHFLCNLLHEDVKSHGLIFKLVLFGVEMKRSPASTKPLEVKLINQKQELILLLKNITLHEEELNTLRNKAEMLCEQGSENQPDALAALMLGSFIFETFVLSHSPKTSASDVNLGFQTALSALGAKIDVSEIDHPLLCEGIRRQRGELALTLILNYKDDQDKLDLILKQLLDKDLLASRQLSQSSSTLIIGADQQQQQQQTVNLLNTKSSVSSTCGSITSSSTTKKIQSIPQEPNQPSEATAHFMFELAKTVFDKAGGSSNTAHLFRPQLVAPNATRGVHRKLHMCTLRIALYALGVQNRTSPNWMQRTYNGRASFIHDQALEIGLPAIKFLCENWEGYLTPVEAASVADKAGCSNDAETKRIAAEMAKSCLKYANHLDSNAVSRILVQCKEQTVEMIEEACEEIEQIAENDNVCPDVLFVTARAWYNLYLKLNDTSERNNCANGNLYQLNNLIAQPASVASNSTSAASAEQQPHQNNIIPFDQQQGGGPVAEWLASSTVQHPPCRLLPSQQTIRGHWLIGNGLIATPPPPPPANAAAVAASSSCSTSSSFIVQPEVIQPIDSTKMPPNHQTQQATVLHPPMWDVYARTDYILTPETPTYTNIDYVRAAFRVGIKAVDSIKLPIHGSKHNSKKLEEILWLLQISESLGRDCLYKFSCSIIKNITDPSTLHTIIVEMIKFFEAIRLPSDHIDRTNVLKPILDKCLDRCTKIVKEMVKLTSHDQKNWIETIFDIVQTLTEVTRTETTAGYYWEILKFVEHKIDTKRTNRRFRIHIDLSQRLNWIKKWASDNLNVCYCDECWLSRNSCQRFRHMNPIRHNNNNHHHETVYSLKG